MTGYQVGRSPYWLVLAALLCVAGTWLYAQRVLVAYQISDATARGKPRGNLSDLYPRWLGARELLLHGRNPYSDEVTREIQAGYYGRPLDSNRPGDPKDKQGFAYPVYVVFYLAPTIELPFDVVRKIVFWLLLVLTLSSIPLWLRTLHWRPGLWIQANIVALILGTMAVMQGLQLQQMTLFVAALVAFAIGFLAMDHPFPAGVLLALATIKPQLVFLLLFWLGVWTLGDVKRRYRWASSFLITLGILFAAAEIWLPHWLPLFWQAARDYQHYADAVPLVDELLPFPWSRMVELSGGIGAVFFCWRNRHSAAGSATFSTTTCLVLAVTLLIVPTYALYNQILLVPALLMLARDWSAIWRDGKAGRVLLCATAILLVWPWLTCMVLVVLSFVLPPEFVQKGWAIPAWTALTLPVAVAALMLLVAYRGSSRTAPDDVTA